MIWLCGYDVNLFFIDVFSLQVISHRKDMRKSGIVYWPRIYLNKDLVSAGLKNIVMKLIRT